jgi:hypothetical protein
MLVSSSRSFRHGYSPGLGFSFFRASDRSIGLDLRLENWFDVAIAVAIGYQASELNGRWPVCLVT